LGGDFLAKAAETVEWIRENVLKNLKENVTLPPAACIRRCKQNNAEANRESFFRPIKGE
jgi:hypothetical protein